MMATALYSFCLLLLVCGQGMTRSIGLDQSVLAVVRGTLYAVDSTQQGAHERLTRRHLESADASHEHALRLDMGPELGALDMRFSQDSVWGNDSVVVVRRGDTEEQVYGMDSSCFMSGYLTSQDGVASLSKCGRLAGIIQARDYHYELEGLHDEGVLADDFSNVKVTLRNNDDDTSGDDVAELDYIWGGPVDKRSVDNIRSRRVVGPVTSESAIYMDANYINNQGRLGRPMKNSLVSFMVNKWNVIKRVMANEQALGLKMTIKLKKIEFWYENPSYYAVLGNRANSSQYLKAFCRNTPSTPNYDHKMLYTYNMGQSHLGMAYLNGICHPAIKCSYVKSHSSRVKVELHEFGHNIGLPHDPQMDCSDPSGDGGFMGWGSNYNILDCYGNKLQQTLTSARAECLYVDNVNTPTLNAPEGSC